MAVRHSVRFVIASDDDLARAEEAIEATDGSITIDAGLDSGELLDIEDFRRLASAARFSNAQVTFTSDDPLRRELARIAGLQVESPEPTVTGLRRALESSAATRKIEPSDLPKQAEPAVAREPAPSLTEALSDYTNHESNESYASFSFVITPPVPRRGDHAADVRHPAGELTRGQPTLRRYRGNRRVGKVAAFASLSAMLLILASALVLVALIAPRATVTLVPATSTINTEITYGIAGTGGNHDVTIDPERVTTTLSYSASIPTTGIRTEPDGSASGSVLMTNPSTAEITVSAGTSITGPDGTAFTTTDDIVVPAADPFGTLTMGSAPVAILSSVPGPEGNLDAGAINGQLDNGLFYSNREPTAGGTLREIAVVTEADIETLRAQATVNFDERASEQIQSEIPEGYRALAGSGRADEPGFAFSHKVGEDATELEIESTMRVSALAYDPDALHEAARAELSRRVTESLPAGSVLLADTMKVADPMKIGGSSGNPEYRLTASAQARMVLDADELANVKREIVGVSEADAVRRVAQIEGVSQFDVDYGPDWFPLTWPPRLESRVTIDVDDRPATQTATGETRP